MKVLVANIGSTSFKFRLFQMEPGAERELAQGGVERIGQPGGTMKWELTGKPEQMRARDFADHGAAIEQVLADLCECGALASPAELDTVAFKAVMAGDYAPVALVDEKLLERMEYFIPVAPAHNKPYIAAMRMFRKALPRVPLVAAFEPGFHASIPARRRYYAAPVEWADKYGVKRYGFHGASHRYIATRVAELAPGKCGRVISCHLGGSSSICAIRDGKSVACSFGLSPQSGLPQNNRAGEFDVFAFELLAKEAGLDQQAVLKALGSAGGLAALSGTSGDMRDVWAAVDAGSERARLAVDVFVTGIRDFLGAYMLEMAGLDMLAFTGGIGLKDERLRAEVCRGLAFAGIELDDAKNLATRGEGRIDAPASATAVWVVPTNEEIIVARQAVELLRG